MTIALDYFGIRNTHWISQIGGDSRAKIQLAVLVRDGQQNLAAFTIPREPIPPFDMDFFQVKAIKDNMAPEIFTGSATSSLTVFVAAYNVNKGPITKAQMDILSKWLGLPDLNILKAAIPDRELIGYYWHTWSPSENWGLGRHYDEQGDGDLRVWLRIGSDQMPEPAQQPVLKPNVKIEGKLPTSVKARTAFVYNASDFAFTLRNNESFEFPIYWHLESPSNPGTEINYVIYPTEGKESVPGDGAITVTAKYWFTTPGNYQWKYVAEYPKGNPVASWEGTLRVNP